MVKKNCSPSDGGLQLVFADECEIHAHPQLAKVWQKKGCPMKVMAAGDDHKFTVYGGFEYQAGYIISYQAEAKDSQEFINWLEVLIGALPDKPILVVLDNARYHKSRKCWEWWQRHRDRICPFFLPAYAPHLNLIERVWRFLKSKLSCHRWWADMPGLMTATKEILTHLQITFYAEGQPSIALVREFCPSA